MKISDLKIETFAERDMARQRPASDEELAVGNIFIDLSTGDGGRVYLRASGADREPNVWRRLTALVREINEILDPGPHELGEATDYRNDAGIDEEELKAELMGRAMMTLPPDARFEIRGKIPTDFGRDCGMCWIWNREMDKADVWPEPNPRAGSYILLGQYVTPGIAV